MSKLENIHISDITPIISPDDLKSSINISEQTSNFVIESRHTISNIINNNDERLLVIIGPCSIHDPKAAIEYAKKLAPLAQKYSDRMMIVMRVYFEKPRTNIGWKGLINDPDLNSSNNIEKGLKTARQLMLDILNLGLPTGSELLDPILPQYYADLICWASIGARTSESQTHREMASGLSTQNGTIARVQSNGNPDAHLIIRGGSNGPNYSSVQMEEHKEKIDQSNIQTQIMIDCSHGNSRKKAKNQHKVLNSVLNQIENGNNNILGVMIESLLSHGNQSIQSEPLTHGMSITDECISWDETETLLDSMYHRLI